MAWGNCNEVVKEVDKIVYAAMIILYVRVCMCV